MSSTYVQRLIWAFTLIVSGVTVCVLDVSTASAQNPFKDLIKDIFGRPGAGKNDAPNPDFIPQEEDPNRWIARDYVDQRAPFARDAHQQIRSLKRLMESDKWKDALDGLQRILDDDSHQIVSNKKGDVISVKTEAMAMLLSAPDDVKELYQSQYQGLAAQMLADAKSNSDFEQILSVSRRYIATPAGREAALLAADYNIDRGEIPSAVRIYEQLIDFNLVDLNDDERRLKIAYAYKLLGDAKRYDAFLEKAGLSSDTLLKRGQQQKSLSDWLTWLDRGDSPTMKMVSELHYPGGTPDRLSRPVTGEPILVPRWSNEIPQQQEIRDETEIIFDQLTTEGEAFPPTHQFVTSGDIGVIRNLQGIVAYNLKTGKQIWESQDLISVEHQLCGKPTKTWMRSRGSQKSDYSYFIVDQEHTVQANPMTSYLFRDHVSQSLSTDGQNVFALSEGVVLTADVENNFWREVSPASNDQFHRDWSSNRISAYNIKDGSVRWMIGGSKRNESFDLPLAGTFFLGTPTPVANTLLVIGENEGEINLYCLDPSTGKPIWSTLLAYADIKIESDVGRRWWTAMPAVSEGLVICPTTVGWLVAVDLYTHEIVWMHRYLGIQPQEREYQQLHYAMTDLIKLSDRWAPGPPMIVDKKVIMAAPEFDRLICLNLHDGSRVFSDMPRKNYTRVLGVVNNQILLSGANTITAVAMDVRKRIVKEFAFDQRVGYLTSVPVVTGDSICFTTTQNQLYRLPIDSSWTFDDLTSQPFRETYRAIGNLFFHQGNLFHVGPFAFTSYEDRKELETQIAEKLDRNPSDAWAMLKQAQLAFSQGDSVKAVACLEQLHMPDLPAEFALLYRQQMMAALIDIIDLDLKEYDEEFNQLAAYIGSEEEKHQYARLKIQRHLARGESGDAFHDLVKLAASPLETPIKLDTRHEIRISELQWVAARLHELASSADAPTKSLIDAYITAHISTPEDQSRLIRILSTHPLLEPILLQVAKRQFAQADQNDENSEIGHWSNAEIICLKLINSANTTIRSQTLVLYARKLIDRGFLAQAERIYKRLTDDVLVDNKLLKSPEVQALRTELTKAPSIKPINQLWGGKSFSMNRLGGHSYQSGTGEVVIRNIAEAPANRFAMHYLVGSSRLVIASADGTTYASIPLTTRGDDYYHEGDVSAWYLGHNLILAYGGYLHCVSLSEKSLLWSHPVDVRVSAYEISIERDPNLYLMRQTRGVSYLLDSMTSQAIPGMIAYLSPDLLCYYGTRSIIAIDPSTGEFLWEHDKIPLGTTVIGTPSLLYLFADDPGESRLLNPRDGSIVTQPELASKLFPALFEQIIAVVDGRFITMKVVNQTFLGFYKPSVVTCWEPTINPETGSYSLQAIWQQEIEYKDYVGKLDQNALLLLSGVPEGTSRANATTERELLRLDLATGTLLDLGTVPTAEVSGVRQMFLLPDGDQAYLVVSKSNTYSNSYQNNYYDLNGITFSGKVYGLDVANRKVMWSQNVRQQTMVLDQYRNSPLLVMINRRGLNKEDIFINELRIQAISKPTGQHVLDYKTTTYENFQSVNVDLHSQSIELATYDTRYRIQLDENAKPVPQPGPATETPDDDSRNPNDALD